MEWVEAICWIAIGVIAALVIEIPVILFALRDTIRG